MVDRSEGHATVAASRIGISVVLTAALLVAALVLPGSSGATFPGRNGRIVFASARTDWPGEGNSEIYELDLANGRSRDLSRTIAYDDTEFAVSPDGTRVAFVRARISNPDAFSPPESRRQLWVMGRDGSDQHRLGDVDFDRARDIVWSGDGTRMAFLAASSSNSANHLWVIGADGSGLRELTDFATAGPRWSPDGSELAFVGENEPGWHIGFIGANGTGLRWLPTPAGTDTSEGASPSWSPDGKELVFFTGLRVEADTVALVGADGSGARTLTTDPDTGGRDLGDLQWLPSGEIGFLEPSTDPLDSTNGHVKLIRPDGSGLRTVADHATSRVAWAPTGDRLAFWRASDPTGRVPPRELVVEPLNGPERVFPLPGLLGRVGNELSGGPAWSPSGASLYFAGTVAPRDAELYSITPQGGDLRQLTRDKMDDIEPAWSHNGRLIAFARQGINVNRYPTTLWLMAADGSHLRRLTRTSVESSLSWAPDNVHLVFARRHRKTNRFNIAVLDTRTGRIRPLASNATAPAWSPDGRLIAFVSPGRRPLRLVRPDGGGERALFDIRDIEGAPPYGSILRPTWSPDGRSIAFTLFRYGKLSSFWERELVVSRTGGAPRQLSCGPSSAPSGPVIWSPDGTALVGSSGGEIWVCPLDGSGAYQLTTGEEPDWQAIR
jgi:TolB protein